MLGSLVLYLKGMRTIMFQLSGFYYSRGRLSASGFRDWGLGFMVMIPEGPYTLPLWN